MIDPGAPVQPAHLAVRVNDAVIQFGKPCLQCGLHGLFGLLQIIRGDDPGEKLGITQDLFSRITEHILEMLADKNDVILWQRCR